MKFLAALILLVIPPAVWAATAVVGTTASYDITVAQSNQTGTGSFVLSVTSIDNGQYMVHGQFTFGSQTQGQDKQMSEDEVTGGGKLLANCASQGGKLEDITVPAGSFHTCHILQPQDNNAQADTWIADVPFGAVKVVQNQNGQNTNLELRSYK